MALRLTEGGSFRRAAEEVSTGLNAWSSWWRKFVWIPHPQHSRSTQSKFSATASVYVAYRLKCLAQRQLDEYEQYGKAERVMDGRRSVLVGKERGVRRVNVPRWACQVVKTGSRGGQLVSCPSHVAKRESASWELLQ